MDFLATRTTTSAWTSLWSFGQALILLQSTHGMVEEGHRRDRKLQSAHGMVEERYSRDRKLKKRRRLRRRRSKGDDDGDGEVGTGQVR